MSLRTTETVIFWDFDGTLAHRRMGWGGTLAALLEENGSVKGVRGEDLARHLGAGFPWHTPERPHPELADSDRFWASLEPLFVNSYIENGLDSVLARDLAKKARAHLIDPRHYELFDDALPALKELRMLGFRQWLITNNFPEIDRIVQSLRLLDFIGGITNSAAVGYEKPHPMIYRLALEAAGSPRTSWMIGDNSKADFAGAMAAGINAILIDRAGSSRSRISDSAISQARGEGVVGFRARSLGEVRAIVAPESRAL